jgi:hypothetical protein
MDDAKEIPLAHASFLNKLGFFWIQPLLVLGYRRTLVAEDLWKMDPTREAEHLADLFEENFYRRKRDVEAWNAALDNGTFRPSPLRKAWWWTFHALTGFGSVDGKKEVGMVWALSDTFRWEFWSAGLFKIVGDVAQTTAPLLTRKVRRLLSLRLEYSFDPGTRCCRSSPTLLMPTTQEVEFQAIQPPHMVPVLDSQSVYSAFNSSMRESVYCTN